MFAIIEIEECLSLETGTSLHDRVMQLHMERQIEQTLIRLLLQEQTDVGLHCLPTICTKLDA